jgi:Putative beta-barrel porin 2
VCAHKNLFVFRPKENKMLNRFNPLRTRTTLAAGCGLLCAASVLAQTAAPAAERPWYVGLNQDFTHTSNVLGSTSGSEVSDTISTTSLLGGVNTRLGRQRLFADATLNTTKYRQIDARDANGYNLNLGMDWSTVERLSGTVRIGAQQRQTDFGGSGIAQVSLSNIEKTQDVDAVARLGSEALLTYEVGVGWRKVDFGAPEFATGAYTQQRGNMGLVIRPSGLLTVRTGLQGSRTDYDASNARAKSAGVYLGATWVPTGISTVTADLNYSREGATAVSDGFKGFTGSLAWLWRPTGLVTTTATLSRATGRDAGFLRSTDANNNPTVTANNFSQVTNRLSLSAIYELTGKVSLTGAVDVSERDYGALLGASGKDRETGLSLGARWAALRTVNVGCDLSYTDRNNISAANTDAKINRFGCNVGVRLD